MRLAFSRNPAQRALERAALAFAAATVTLLILMFARPYFTNAAKPQLPLPSILAIQFPRNVDDIDAILSDAPSPDREVLRIKLDIDYFLIPSYVGLLVTLALRHPKRHPAIAAAAALTAVAAGVFNVIQDRTLLQALNTPLTNTTQQIADSIRRSALAKWSLLAICAVTLVIEWQRTRQNKT
jgi:hypothetical protein